MVLNRKFSAICFSAILFSSNLIWADILFEGYYKRTVDGKSSGFSISRYEFDAKKKEFVSSSFLVTNDLEGNLTESLKTISTSDFTPKSYQYTLIFKENGKTKTRTVDGTVTGSSKSQKLSTVMKVDGVSQKSTVDLPKGAFFSNVLLYMILKSPSGLSTKTNFSFEAIAEEQGKVGAGKAAVESLETWNGLKSYRVKNNFFGDFTAFVGEKGDIFEIKADSIKAQLVATPGDATQGFSISSGILKNLFGNVPEGLTNELSKSKPVKMTAPSVPGKTEGIPPGKGIQIKTEETK